MSFLNELKTQTAEQHAALETHMDIVRHFETKGSYLKLLERFFTLYGPLEQRLEKAADWSQTGWDFEARLKTPWLREDLQALGLSEQDIVALPRCTDLPEVADLAEAVGCLYVLEGSTLGGQVITRLLNQHLPISPQTGGMFFAGYQNETVSKWRQFGGWAESWASKNPDQTSRAIDAARKTFDSFARWFN